MKTLPKFDRLNRGIGFEYAGQKYTFAFDDIIAGKSGFVNLYIVSDSATGSDVKPMALARSLATSRASKLELGLGMKNTFAWVGISVGSPPCGVSREYESFG